MTVLSKTPAAQRARNGAPPGGGDAPAERGRLSDLLGYFLRRAEVAAMQNFGEHMRPDGVSPGQLGVLLIVEANRGINQTRIGRALGIDRSTLVAIVDHLERRHLLVRRPAEGDRRSHALSLTPEGAAFLARIMPRLRKHEAEIARGLSAEERRQLIDLLGRIAEPRAA